VAKVIVELQAKPGRRAELKRLIESIVAERGPSQRGFLGSTRYEVLDDPDRLIEIADWESAQARVTHMQESTGTGTYEPLLGMLAAPFRATVIRQLPGVVSPRPVHGDALVSFPNAGPGERPRPAAQPAS